MANIGKDLALLTAGSPEHFNALTILYGALGTIWGKNAYFAFIKPERYTWKFINDSEYFTVSYFPKELNDIHSVFGYKSGRDTDKVKEAGVTPEFLTNCVTFKEAREVFICRKIYMNQMNRSEIPADVAAKYNDPNDLICGEPHYAVIGEIIGNIVR